MPTGGFWTNARNITKFFIYLFIPSIGELAYRSAGWQIFALDGSNDEDTRKDVPFGVSLLLLPI